MVKPIKLWSLEDFQRVTTEVEQVEREICGLEAQLDEKRAQRRRLIECIFPERRKTS